MTRKKELVLVAHCVLNQNAVINGWERAEGGFNSVLQSLLKQNVGIIQLPCPELTHLGCNRPPMTKEDYSTPAYIELCTKLAKEHVSTLLEYKNSGYKLLGMIGIEKSPTCDTTTTKGIFMELFIDLCKEHDINLMTFDIPEPYVEGITDITISF